VATKLRGRQVALFVHDGAVLACNNRCPHEGYPLCEGSLDDTGVLTCQWHNWKFDLRNGANLYGGDSLRTYPVRVLDGQVWVDVSEPPAAQRIAAIQAHLDEALADDDYPRIARELARLERAGAAPETSLLHALEQTHSRLRYGMTHAYAAADAWLRLRDSLTDPGQRLACATEALAHIGFDTLREQHYPYTAARQNWHEATFLAAVEAQDETAAIAALNDALATGRTFSDLEPTLATAALAHYNDFGHSLIYLTHLRSLVERLGVPATAPLLRAWIRSVIHATREDLLPDFKAYAGALSSWPDTVPPESLGPPPAARQFEALAIRHTLSALLGAAAQHPPSVLWNVLMETAAHHLLRFDARLALRTNSPVTDEVGWLDFSHALTFGHAVRLTCTQYPALWPQGLLQMAMFIGRNTPYLAGGVDSATAQAAWEVGDANRFDAQAQAQIIDHGIGLPIFSVHRLKTWLAVRDAVAIGVSDATAAAMRAAVKRLLDAQFKQRHALRTAHQALRFVERE
jgi:nitrite reductase/ring-hydroxylating ferredoxin subunit